MYIPPIKLACPIKVFWLPNVEHDAHGTLWEFNRCGFGLITLPEVFTAFVGEAFGPLKGTGVQNWLDDIIIYTQQVEGQLNLLRQMLDKLSRAGLSVNFSKSSSDQDKTIIPREWEIIDCKCTKRCAWKITAEILEVITFF